MIKNAKRYLSLACRTSRNSNINSFFFAHSSYVKYCSHTTITRHRAKHVTQSSETSSECLILKTKEKDASQPMVLIPVGSDAAMFSRLLKKCIRIQQSNTCSYKYRCLSVFSPPPLFQKTMGMVTCFRHLHAR